MKLDKVKNGIRIGEGDGTVALISLGGICVEGWKRSRWNPANISVVTYEVRPALCPLIRQPNHITLAPPHSSGEYTARWCYYW